MAFDRYSSRRRVLQFTSDLGPALASTQGCLYLAWVERETGALLLSSGEAASLEFQTAVNGYSQHSPGLCVDAEGSLVLVWADRRSGRLFVSRARERSVEAPQVFEHRSAHAPAACLFRERVHVAWTGDDARVHLISYSSRGWSKPRLVKGAHADGPPALAPAADLLHVVWRNVDRGLSRTASEDGETFQRPVVFETRHTSAPSAVVRDGRLAAAWLEDDTMVFDSALEDADPEGRETWPYAAVSAPTMAAHNEGLILAWTAADASCAITIKPLELAAAISESEFTFHGDAIAYDPLAP